MRHVNFRFAMDGTYPARNVNNHRSFIFAKGKIDAITATDVEINNKLIPIGRSYKETVQAIIEK
ncbi:MAG: hypothetical protein IPO42_03780 [Chitinophagaceae bacterium]|nr:hypothetical protein [Chitinophagaceae bacterium]